MPRFSNQEYADILFVYGFCNGNGRAAVRQYQQRFPNRRTPNHQTFGYVYGFLAEHGTLPAGKKERAVIAENILAEENILDIVNENPRTSTRRIAAQLHVSQSKVCRSLKNENLHPYHIQKVQRLEPGDNVPRLQFSRWIRNHRQIIYRTLFTDEAQFTRDGINNSRNSHIWSEENPHAVRQCHSQHRFQVNVWCGLINNHLVGPHFFEERLNGDVYLNFLQDILPGMLDGINIRGRYFQHDGASPHFALAVRHHLDNVYPNRWIGRGGPHMWPPRSPDFNPLDYFLWGHLKTMVYAEDIQTRQQLIERINNCCDIIRNSPDIIRQAISHLMIRQRKCTEANGLHFENHL